MKDLDDWKKEELALHDATLAEAYEQEREAIRHGRFYQDYWMETMLGAATPPSEARALDYCCGTSILFPHLKRRWPDASYLGIDLSPEMLEVGNRRFADREDFQVLQRDGESLQLEREFDVVIARGALHHLPQPEIGLREIAGVLKDGGTLIVSEPAANPVIRFARWCMYKLSGHFSSKHRSFSYGELKHYLQAADYKIERVQRFGFLAYPFGFPDIIPFYRLMPFPLFKGLIRVDELLAKIPLVRSLSFSVIVVATPVVTKE